jgi:hypothetical protein
MGDIYDGSLFMDHKNGRVDSIILKSKINQYLLLLRVYKETGISETLKKVLISTTFDQSRLVSVSTTTNFHSLKKSWSRQF